ncbi:FkbM family methyltransferase [Aliarcobacter cryaerophilus]|uniref:FkbM family methyltransferase n=1 Tax=Aliarcobacter cryaerophilus TaxID=28198 RepID=UPI003DA2C358
MNKYVNFIIRLFKTYVLRDRFLLSAKQWFKDDGDKTLRLNYPLNENSIVFDIGGYEGKFADEIFNKYQCTIYVFEPVDKFYKSICERFKNNSKIKVFNFGLSDKDEEMMISISDDASSIHKDADNKQKIRLKSINDFIIENKIQHINLMKINIEGGEFQVLPALIDSNFVANIENLQIQFHNFIPNSVEMRENIRKELSKTHQLTYDYYFVWENWKLVK